jgi:hypothetical protein
LKEIQGIWKCRRLSRALSCVGGLRIAVVVEYRDGIARISATYNLIQLVAHHPLCSCEEEKEQGIVTWVKMIFLV